MKIAAINSRLRSEHGTPVLPRPSDKMDPTRQLSNRNKAFRQIARRLDAAKKEIRALVKSIPRVVLNNDNGVIEFASVLNVDYTFLVDADLAERISIEIERILKNNLMGDADSLRNFWLYENTRYAYYSGADEALQSAKNITPANLAGRELSSAIRQLDASIDSLFERGRANRAALVGSRAFEKMKGLTDESRSDLAFTLTDGILKGQGIQEITRNMMDRVDVTGTRAARIARTEINSAYRSASRQEARVLNNDVYDESDFEMRLLWFSAFTPNTRETHASRHGETYTIDEVESFYSRDANEINCYCSQTYVLVNKRTGEILQQDLVDQMKEQKRKELS